MFQSIQLLFTALFLISSCKCIAAENPPKFSLVTAVSKPLECFGEGCRKLTLESRTPDNTSFTVICEGLEPNESLLMMSLSEDEVIKSNMSANSKWSLQFGSNPTVIGKKSGTATISIISKSGKYKPLTLSYIWGK